MIVVVVHNHHHRLIIVTIVIIIIIILSVYLCCVFIYLSLYLLSSFTSMYNILIHYSFSSPFLRIILPHSRLLLTHPSYSIFILT